MPRLRRSICSRDAKPGPRAGAGGSDGGEEGIERRRRGWRRALPRERHGGQGRTRTRLYEQAMVVMEFSTRHDEGEGYGAKNKLTH